MLHIIDRFLIHFFASGGVMLAAFYGLRVARKKMRWPILPSTVLAQLVTAGLLIFACAILREAFDVAAGQTTTKAVFDYISWAAGCGIAAWGLYKLAKMEV